MARGSITMSSTPYGKGHPLMKAWENQFPQNLVDNRMRILNSDTDTTKTIKKNTNLHYMKQPIASDPFRNTTNIKSFFQIELEMSTPSDSSQSIDDVNMIVTESIKNEILKLARDIIRERKGLR